jgi:uncharacterized SAM-binding protein YcdF (DUF218 family)
MQRARQLFERAGFVVFAYPVNIRVDGDALTLMSFLPGPGALNATHSALHEVMGRLYYQLKHL